MTDAEFMFSQEVQEKKRTARGASNRASRSKGYKGSVKTAYDFLTTRQRKDLNGKVRCFNVDDQIMDLIAFKLLERPAQTELLTKYLEKHSKEEIAKVWNCSKGNVDAWRATVGLAKTRVIADTKKKVSKDLSKSIKSIVDSTYVEKAPSPSKVIAEAQAIVKEIPTAPVDKAMRAFSLRLEKGMVGSEIKEALLNYATILDDSKVYDFLMEINGD